MLRRAGHLIGVYACALLAGACSYEGTPVPPEPSLAEAPGDSAHEWSLEDDSKLRVTLDPSPPVAGKDVVLDAELELGDWSNRDHQPRVRVRITNAPDSGEPWKPLVPDHEDDTTLYFRHTTRLASGRHYIQFEISRQGFSRPSVFADWAIDVP